MLALISFPSIRASTLGDLADCDLVNVSSTACEIKDFLFMRAVFTCRSVAVDQEHALGFDTSESFKIAVWWLLTETLKALLV